MKEYNLNFLFVYIKQSQLSITWFWCKNDENKHINNQPPFLWIFETSANLDCF